MSFTYDGLQSVFSTSDADFPLRAGGLTDGGMKSAKFLSNLTIGVAFVSSVITVIVCSIALNQATTLTHVEEKLQVETAAKTGSASSKSSSDDNVVMLSVLLSVACIIMLAMAAEGGARFYWHYWGAAKAAKAAKAADSKTL